MKIATLENDDRVVVITRVGEVYSYRIDMYQKDPQVVWDVEEHEDEPIRNLIKSKHEKYRNMAFSHALNWIDHGR